MHEISRSIGMPGILFKDTFFHYSLIPLFRGCLKTSNLPTNIGDLIEPLAIFFDRYAPI
jgi:hypothetical protein